MYGERGHVIEDVRAERHHHQALGVSNEKPSWTRGLATAFLGLALLALVGLMIANAVIG